MTVVIKVTADHKGAPNLVWTEEWKGEEAWRKASQRDGLELTVERQTGIVG